MEVVGALASGFTIAALFRTCVEAFKIFHATKSQDRDLRRLITQLNLQKCRLQCWGDTLGIRDPQSEILTTANTCYVPVKEALIDILHLFNKIKRLRQRYGCKVSTLTSPTTLTIPAILLNAEQYEEHNLQPATRLTLAAKIRWATHDQKRFVIFVREIESLITNLHGATQSLSVPSVGLRVSQNAPVPWVSTTETRLRNSLVRATLARDTYAELLASVQRSTFDVQQVVTLLRIFLYKSPLDFVSIAFLAAAFAFPTNLRFRAQTRRNGPSERFNRTLASSRNATNAQPIPDPGIECTAISHDPMTCPDECVLAKELCLSCTSTLSSCDCPWGLYGREEVNRWELFLRHRQTLHSAEKHTPIASPLQLVASKVFSDKGCQTISDAEGARDEPEATRDDKNVEASVSVTSRNQEPSKHPRPKVASTSRWGLPFKRRPSALKAKQYPERLDDWPDWRLQHLHLSERHPAPYGARPRPPEEPKDEKQDAVAQASLRGSPGIIEKSPITFVLEHLDELTVERANVHIVVPPELSYAMAYDWEPAWKSSTSPGTPIRSSSTSRDSIESLLGSLDRADLSEELRHTDLSPRDREHLLYLDDAAVLVCSGGQFAGSMTGSSTAESRESQRQLAGVSICSASASSLG